MAVSKVLVEKHVDVPLRDGVVTRGDLYRPAEGDPVPGLDAEVGQGRRQGLGLLLQLAV